MSKNHDITFFYFKSMYQAKNAETKSISEIVQIIKSGAYANQIDRIRQAESREEKNKLKLELPAFHPAFNASGGNISASGIVWFDIDKKDNVEVDFAELKRDVLAISSCLCAFTSPSGGLKFGILTDFTDAGDDDVRIRERYKKAYKLTRQYVLDQVGVDFLDDDTATSIWQKCYLSHDVDAYINLSCKVYQVNGQCSYVPYKREMPSVAQHGVQEIAELLELIPRDLSYNERLPINFSVLGCLGREGISLLLEHWRVEDRAKLQSDLEEQIKNFKFVNIGYLVKLAKKHKDFKNIGGWARRKIKAKPSDLKLDKLLSPDEGVEQLRKIVRSFFCGERNVFVNVSTGAGKSKTVLDVLAQEIPYAKKVLILVPSHSLADELEQKFKNSRNNPQIDELEKKHLKPYDVASRVQVQLLTKKRTSGIVHLRGKTELCVNEFAKKKLGVSNIPWQFCSGCYPPHGCNYIEQFRNKFDNIRIMTHNEWSNHQSSWFGGYEEKFDEELGSGEEGWEVNGRAQGRRFPKAANSWKPDYIVIDENIINADLRNKLSESGDKHPSIKKIIEGVADGLSLVEAIDNNLVDVLKDGIKNNEPAFPSFGADLDDYLCKIQARCNDMREYSRVLGRLERYCRTQDPADLKGIWVEDGKLLMVQVVDAADRYRNTPTLFLDATAGREVVEALFPSIEFHSINIESKRDINLYQLGNTTISRMWLSKKDCRDELVKWLHEIIAANDYKNVGLITYMEVDGIEGCFDQYLAKQLSIKTYGHFGAIRGLDLFDDVDCLLVVGRHFIGADGTRNLASAIFSEKHEYDSACVDLPVRMKNGSTQSLNCLIPCNEHHLAIHNHFSVGETKQAVGRARYVHGKTKDVYLFSNESLGLDIEVTDFFYREVKSARLCSDEAIQNIIEVGYVEFTPKALVQIGLNPNDVKNYKLKIENELAEVGIALYACKMKDKSGRQKDEPYSYFIFDKSKFVAGELVDERMFIEFA